MARFHGEVGYGRSVEDPPESGIMVQQITEKTMTGEVIRNTRSLEASPEKLNDDISLGNSISVVADQYAIENYAFIKYVRWDGALWRVNNVEIRRPRLILSFGGVYNGPTP